MTGKRTMFGLLFGAVALVGAHVALDVKTREAPHALRRNALAPSAEKALAFSFSRPGEPTIRLDGKNGWKIVSPFVAVAEPRIVLRLADALAFAPIAEEMTETELLRIGRTREDFSLERPRLVVTIDGDQSAETVLSFGVSTPAGDGVYAMVDKSDAVCIVSSNVFAAVNLSVRDLRRRRLAEFDPVNVASLDVRNGSGRCLRLMRTGESWEVSEPRSCRASSSRIGAFLEGLAHLEAQDFIWPVGASNELTAVSASLLAGYGLEAESAVTVTLKMREGTDRIILSFGRESGKDHVYALVPGGGAIVTVSDEFSKTARMGLDAFVDARLFPVEEKKIATLALEENGTTYLLSRGPDAAWHLDAPVSAPADASVAEALVARLLTLKATDVEADGIRVSVGTNLAPFSVSRKILLPGMRLEDLRSKDILELDPKRVKRIVATDSAKKPVSIVFDAEKSVWMAEKAGDAGGVDGESVAKMLGALSPLRALRIVQLRVTAAELGKFGLDKPIRTVAIDCAAEGSLRRNILIGDLTDGGRFATLGASDAVFVISSESVTALLALLVK